MAALRQQTANPASRGPFLMEDYEHWQLVRSRGATPDQMFIAVHASIPDYHHHVPVLPRLLTEASAEYAILPLHPPQHLHPREAVSGRQSAAAATDESSTARLSKRLTYAPHQHRAKWDKAYCKRDVAMMPLRSGGAQPPDPRF